MNTSRVNTCTCTTKRNATRQEVWRSFLEFREAGLGPILMDSAKGWSYVCLPSKVQPETDESLEFLNDICGDFNGDAGPDFVGGWVGFLTYDLGLKWMGLGSWHPSRLPLMQWRFCDKIYAFQVEKEDGGKTFGGSFSLRNLESQISESEYEKAISKIHNFERKGDSYQVNFARELLGDFDGDPFVLYMRMFEANPSDMCFYFEEKDFVICSNSPERLFSLKDGKLRAEPIKGTIGLDEDPSVLLSDEKLFAELTMIVDLLRNDFAKVAMQGSVRVLKHQELMELSHVLHSYSVIEAELGVGKSVVDVLTAVFPGGSVTGCPKKRTMEIIDELESFSRGAYCGSAGYVSVNGNVDFNIMIRTATIKNAKISFPVGGGILIDSDARGEFEETVGKAQVFFGLTCL